MSSSISELCRDLDSVTSAGSSENLARAVEILKQLEGSNVSAQVLSETKAGKLVAKLQKHPNTDIQTAAAKVIKKWKSAVLPPPTSAAANPSNPATSTSSTTSAVAPSATVPSASGSTGGEKPKGTSPLRSPEKEKQKTPAKETVKTPSAAAVTEEKESAGEKDQDKRSEKSLEKEKDNKDGSKASSSASNKKSTTTGITKTAIKEEKITKEKEKEKEKEKDKEKAKEQSNKGKKRKSKSPEREESIAKKSNTGKEKEKEKEKDGKEKPKKVSPTPKRNTVSPSPFSRPPTASSFPTDDDEPDHPVDGIYRLGSHAVEIRNKIQKMIYDALGNPPPDYHPVPLATRLKRMKGGQDKEKQKDEEKESKMEEGSTEKTKAEEAAKKEALSSKAEVSSSGSKSPLSVSIAAAVSSDSSPLPSPTTSSSGMDVDRTELAYIIELAMFIKFSRRTDQDYRTKARNVVYALNDKSNPDINFHLYRGLLDPDTFLNFSEKDLASEELKEKRRKAWEWSRAAARSDISTGEANSDQFPCEKCGERKCKYFMQQTRGADEPMTIFVTCLTCGHKFRSGDNC